MTRRILSSRLGALAAMALLASSGVAADKNPVELRRKERQLEEPEMNFKAEYRSRSKRGGNGKGRKWWNS